MIEPDLFHSTGAGDAEAIDWLNSIFFEASRLGASDIHFQEKNGRTRVRFRIAGSLADQEVLPPQMTSHVDTKIRARARLATGDRVTPQDGRMQLRYPDRRVDVRVSLTPNLNGQCIVCRLLDHSTTLRRIAEIEMTNEVRLCIRRIIQEPQGLFLITGPTGSGKTTTLYAIVNELNTEDRHIITIEDPVEYQVDGLTQMNVDVNLTFPRALRTAVRQDPDVILVGEIRDSETAKIAVEAANTGHLVLGTLHTNGAAEVATRLIDLGIDPATLAAALRGASAQRLVKGLDQALLAEGEIPMMPPDDSDRAWMRSHGIDPPEEARFPFATTPGDYDGRIPVIELIMFDSATRAAVPRGLDAIRQAAGLQPQYETLAEAGTRLAATGVTTLAEIRRVTSSLDVVHPPEAREEPVPAPDGRPPIVATAMKTLFPGVNHRAAA